MKPNRIITVLLLLFSIWSVQADDYCKILHTPIEENTSNKTRSLELIDTDGPFTVRLFFHIIRHSDGTGGQTIEAMNSGFNYVKNDFGLHNIKFISLGYDYIDSEAFYYYANLNLEELFLTKIHENAIDVYLLPQDSQFGGGCADNIVAKSLAVGGSVTYGGVTTNLVISRVLSHEVGHCLGLFHTFHGTYEGDSGSCKELVNGSNGESCGDYIKDTAADPVVLRSLPSTDFLNCIWNNTTMYDENGDLYKPDPSNIMSYSYPQCITNFTAGQGLRMREKLATESVLATCILPNKTFIQNETISSGSQIYEAAEIISIGNNVTSTLDQGDVLIDNSAIVKLKSYKKIFIQPGTTIDPFNNGKFTAEILSYQTDNQSNPSFLKHYNKSVKQNIDDYYPLLNNSKWFEINKGGFEGVVNDFYYIGGDTTINNKHYYEIRFKSFKLPNVFNYPYSDYINSHSLIYLREDVANKKIYTPTKWNNSESLLYDFSLNINDKMPYDTAFTLIRIDTVEITGDARKRFNFQNKNNYKVTWIEGIGNISSPFHVDTPISDFDKLICSYQNNEVIYDEGVVNGINCTDYKDAESGLDDVEINSCTLYPNPTQGKFRISLNNTAKIKSLKIIDIHGKLVSDVGDNLNLDQIDLNISSLFKGVYFCVICTGKEVGTFKIIKE